MHEGDHSILDHEHDHNAHPHHHKHDHAHAKSDAAAARTPRIVAIVVIGAAVAIFLIARFL